MLSSGVPVTDLRSRLDPELVPAYDQLPARDLSDIPAARRVSQAVSRTFLNAEADPNVLTRDVTVSREGGEADLRSRCYRPAHHADPLPCLYWIHGGGHVMGEIDQDGQSHRMAGISRRAARRSDGLPVRRAEQGDGPDRPSSGDRPRR